ncbi:MAG: hypothetical protein Kow0010_22590 [Dehalococcoidia bacterium]
MTTQTQPLPYGVGRFSPGWFALAGILVALIAVGVAAYYREATEGMTVTGLRDVGTMGGATWGLYIVFVVYFVGVSFAGITIAAIIRILNLEYLRPVSRMAELLTVIALALAAMMVIADLGQPLRGFINLFRYARPQSPFFGTFTLVISAYFIASLIFLALSGRSDAYRMAQREGRLRPFYRAWASGYRGSEAERIRHWRTTFWLSLAIIPLLVVAHTTLGLVFGLMAARPGWFSALQAPEFVIMAGISGIGHIIVIAAIFRQYLGEREKLNIRVFRWLGGFLLVLVLVYLYFTAVDMMTAAYGGPYAERQMMSLLITGTYAPLFWLSLVALVVSALALGGQAITGRWSIPLTVTVAVLVNVAALSKRYLIVVPSQTDGMLLPYNTGSYTPTWVEVSVVIGALALGALVYMLFAKVFPMMETADGRRPVETPESRWVMSRRGVLAVGMVVAGVAIMLITYFFLAAPWGFPPDTVAHSNPRLTFAPALFIVGIVITFVAAVVYELWPSGGRNG